jgi:ubiquinone/menaquinone biosynthesis C-methylase UbiE
VGLYCRIVFPLLCDWGLNRPFVAEHRRSLLTHANGTVLEIGFGTGLNLECYPPHIRKISAIDPNKGMYRRAQKRIERSAIEVNQCLLKGDRLPFDDQSFDCVVSTFTLCSIGNITLALEEIFRVLTIGGRFLFLEHGLSPDPGVQKWQHRLNGLQKLLAGGCHLDRDIQALVTALPFASTQIEEYYMEKAPKTHGYMFQGSATK